MSQTKSNRPLLSDMPMMGKGHAHAEHNCEPLVCPVCNGTGYVTVDREEDCANCYGEGVTYK